MGRNLLEYGFIAYTGVEWTDRQVDEYNRLQKQISAFGDSPPETLLNASHKLFVMFSSQEIGNSGK